MSNYDSLIANLDSFIRKYYLNKLLKGGLYFIGFNLAIYLIINLLEYNYFFSSSVRKGLLALLVIGFVSSLIFWVITPLTRFFKLGKQISNEQAATIIGEHFAEVKDKLLNILQLKNQLTDQSDNSQLLASIEQKASDIRLVSFPKAIQLGENKKYLKYALPPLMILMVILVSAPYVIKDSTNRIVNVNFTINETSKYKA